MTEPKRGRPSVGPELRGVRVDQTTYDAIEHLAAVSGDTRSEVVRMLLGEALAAHDARRARIEERYRTPVADLLEDDSLEARVRAIVRDELSRQSH